MEPCQEDQTEERLFAGLRRLAHTPHAQPSKSTHSSQTTGFTASGQTEAFCQSHEEPVSGLLHLLPGTMGTFCAFHLRQLIACFLTWEAKDLHLEFFCC